MHSIVLPSGSFATVDRHGADERALLQAVRGRAPALPGDGGGGGDHIIRILRSLGYFGEAILDSIPAAQTTILVQRSP